MHARTRTPSGTSGLDQKGELPQRSWRSGGEAGHPSTRHGLSLCTGLAVLSLSLFLWASGSGHMAWEDYPALPPALPSLRLSFSPSRPSWKPMMLIRARMRARPACPCGPQILKSLSWGTQLSLHKTLFLFYFF